MCAASVSRCSIPPSVRTASSSPWSTAPTASFSRKATRLRPTSRAGSAHHLGRIISSSRSSFRRPSTRTSRRPRQLVVEPSSGINYVFWQSWTNLIQAASGQLVRRQIVGDPIEVVGPGFAWRSSPAFAVTRDTFVDLDAAGTANRKRSTHALHILWSEEDHDGQWQTKYAPWSSRMGSTSAIIPILNLNRPDRGLQVRATVATDLKIAPTLKPGETGNSVMRGLPRPAQPPTFDCRVRGSRPAS